MSNKPDLDINLEQHFLPDWAQKTPNILRYDHYDVDRKEDRPGRKRARRDSGPRGDRPQGGGRRDFQRDRQRTGKPSPRPQRSERRPFQRPPELNLDVSFIPDEKGVESIARQVKLTARAYPLFEIAQMILKKPNRHQVRLKSKSKKEGSESQVIFLCSLDQSIWLKEDEAVNHVLKQFFDNFYKEEKTPTDPPKGVYTFVAQCGISRVILGPPNYHGYQNNLRALHKERFSKMNFEAFKAKVRIVRDEEIVKKWIEDQSWTTEYICLNVPEEEKLKDREAVTAHFRKCHLPNIISRLESFTFKFSGENMVGSASIKALVRHAWEDQKRFPLKVVNVLSQQFARLGLQFFKISKSITHVSVARPRFLNLATTPVSDSVKNIVNYVSEKEKCTRRDLVEKFTPEEFKKEIEKTASSQAEVAPAAVNPPPEKPADTAAADTEETKSESSEPVSENTESDAPQKVAPSETKTAEEHPVVSAAMQSLISDLHWLLHQGHVIEYANGMMEIAKQPIVQAGKPGKKRSRTGSKVPAGKAASDSPASAEGKPSAEKPSDGGAAVVESKTETSTNVSPQVKVNNETEASDTTATQPTAPVETTKILNDSAETVSGKSDPVTEGTSTEENTEEKQDQAEQAPNEVSEAPDSRKESSEPAVSDSSAPSEPEQLTSETIKGEDSPDPEQSTDSSPVTDESDKEAPSPSTESEPSEPVKEENSASSDSQA